MSNMEKKFPTEVPDFDFPLKEIEGMMPNRSKFIQFRVNELFIW